jgi:hypothetical protein
VGTLGIFPDIFVKCKPLLHLNSEFFMISLVNSQDSSTNNTAVIKRLARAIMISQGQFSLLIACCNSVKKQKQILSVLEEFSPVQIQEIHTPASAKSLYTIITDRLASIQPDAVIVSGLEAVEEINDLITSTNMMRDELRKQFQFPLILWVNDDVLRKLIWLAPDLKDWAACTLRFDSTASFPPVVENKSHRLIA